MAINTLDIYIKARLREPHEVCLTCDRIEKCFEGKRGVVMCTKWDDSWRNKKDVKSVGDAEPEPHKPVAPVVPVVKAKDKAIAKKAKDAKAEKDQGRLF